MPEENQTPEQTPPQTVHVSSEPVKEVEMPAKKGNKLPLIIGAAVVLVLLIAAGFYIAGQNSGSDNKQESTKEATGSSSQNTNSETKTETINKIGYTDKNNVWVLDVSTKSRTQITKDAGVNQNGVYYQSPIFIDSKSFLFIKVTKAGSELWKGTFDGNKFSVEQDKTFKSQVRLHDVSPDGKKILFDNHVNNKVRVHLFELATDKDTIFYEKDEVGRGASQDDAFYSRFSPDGTKILLADTIYSSEHITIWDSSAKKIDSLAGNVTLPAWIDNSSFVYKENAVGLHRYNLNTKKSEGLSSEKDWSGLEVSPNGKKLAHNKGLTTSESGMSDSSVGLFDLEKKSDASVGSSLAFPVWVNDTFLIVNKVRKCNATECAVDDSFTTDYVIVVINTNNNQKFEVKTEASPNF